MEAQDLGCAARLHDHTRDACCVDARTYVPPWTQMKEQELPEAKPEEQEITEIKAEQKPKVPSPPPTAASDVM